MISVSEDIILNLLIFITLFKISLLKTLDNFELGEILGNGDLMHVKDYHNLSLVITTSKKVYMGFPPNLKYTFSGSTTKYTNAITCNSNFAFITCTQDNIIKKINLKTGKISAAIAGSYTQVNSKKCAVCIQGNSAYIIVSSEKTDYITSTIFNYAFDNMNDEINGPYSYQVIFGASSNQISFSYNKADIDQQVDLECISPYEDENDIHLIFFYVSPESVDGETIYYLIGVIERKKVKITSSKVITDIKAYKLNYYTIRCILKYKQLDLTIKKNDTEYKFSVIENSYKTFKEELISYNNVLTFLASGAYIKITKANYQNYYMFSIKSTIKNILGIYNETTDHINVYYKTENSVNYISFQNSSFYFQIKAQSSEYIKEYANNKTVNIKQMIIPNDDYENIKLSKILYEGGNITDNFYIYKELSRELIIFGNPKDPNIKAIFIFNSLYENQSNIDINLYLDPSSNITIEFEGCSFYCNLCFYHYKDCDLQNCIKNYAFIKNTDDCYPNNQLFKNYIYNSATKYFEKCYKSCDFCSAMESESSILNHNCYSCSDGYLKSYEYIGNCYKINNNEIDSDKIIINQKDTSFTIVQSCAETGKKLKINSTGECVSQCPKIKNYKNYTYQYANFTSEDYNPNISQYQEIDEIIPKYNLGDLCVESCPLDYEADEENNLCICKGESCKECRTNEKKFYLKDKEEFTENACSNQYYQFYFDCYLDACPSNTSISKTSPKMCESDLNYCYIDNCYNSHCFLDPIKDYIYRFENSKQYLKSCNESINYTIKNVTTYLYQNVCYSSCPENTEANDEMLICNCKYYKYSENYDIISNNYICFSEIEKCREYVPVVDLKICLNSINDCIIKNYKIFNKECYSKNCPLNTKITDDTLYCSCSNYFYNDSYYLNCLPESSSCQSFNYFFKNPYTKECFNSIEDCVIKGNLYILNDNCYKDNCPYGAEIEIDNGNLSYYICEIQYDIPYIIPETGITLNYCPPIEILENICLINYIFDDYLEEITENIESIIFNDTLLGDEEIVIFGNNIIYQITTSDSDVEYNNVSHIDFGECEEILKEKYNISYLLILKYDITINETIPTKVEYNVYDPDSKEKLNLSFCENKINIKSPLKINDNSLNLILKLEEKRMNIFDKYDPFYYDICFKFRSEYGTDMILSDRRKVYYREEQLFCEEGCHFLNYDIESQFVECECTIKIQPIKNISIIDFDFKKDDLSTFFNIKTYANFACIKCYKLFFSKIGLINNYGNYLLLIEILVFLTFLILFYSKYQMNISNLISNSINEVQEPKNPPIKKNNQKNDNKPKMKIENKNKIHKIDNKPKMKYGNINQKIVNRPKQKFSEKNSTKYLIKNKNKVISMTSKSKKIDEKINMKSDISSTSKILTKSLNSNSIINSRNNFLKIKINSLKDNYKDLNDEEMNSLEYEKAYKIDKRTFFQMYWALIKKKQIILFSFMPINDFNLFYMKICLFLFSFALSIAVNGLFFSDETMHKIYKDKGIFNFLYQLPKIIYSLIISSVINLLVKYFGLSEKNIIKLRKNKSNKDEIKIEVEKTIKVLKVKFNLFFILSFLFLLLFWYYVGVFCAVYENTQIPLFKDTLISFMINLFYPFALVLLPCIFRILSLRNENRKVLYKVSKIISLI